MDHRLEELRKGFAERGLDALYVTNLTNVRYLTGFTGSAGYLFIGSERTIFFVDSRYVIQAQAQTAGMGVEVVFVPGSMEAGVHEAIAGYPERRIGIEAGTLTVAALERMTERLPEHTLVPVLDAVERLRIIKDADEIAAIRRAAALTDEVFEYALSILKPGVTEADVAMDMEYRMRERGADGPAFNSIIASGLNGAKPHAGASGKAIEAGDLVTMDFGCCVDGYNADITRTVCIGHATDRQREIYAIVQEAQRAGAAALTPGVSWKAVDAAARDIITTAGFGDNFGHGLGHTVGLDVHDVFGRLSPNAKDGEVVEAGQVWTVEPGIYIEGWGGVRIEDDVLVTPNGPETLTQAPKDFLVL